MNVLESNTYHQPSPDIRVVQLDVLRGIAVLGIYWINVAVFALPYSVYILPVLLGEATQANTLVWAFSEVFIDGTMRGLFSMLFGASAMLFLDESRLAGGGLAVVDRYYRRTLLLMLFGLIHAWLLLWPYDVLYAYGLFGLFLFPLRKLSARTLLIVGLVLLMLGDMGVNQPPVVDQPTHSKPADTSTTTQPDTEISESINLQIAEEIDVYSSGYMRIFNYQQKDIIEQQSINMYDTHFFDIGGMMLFGMALFKLGVLSGRRPRELYLKMMFMGYLFGIMIRGPDAYAVLINGFEITHLFNRENMTYNLGKLAMTLGHIGLIGLLYQFSLFDRLARILAATGRLALTNYIMQTIISLLIFYGIGLGLYAQYERYQLVFICLAVWLFQIGFSLFWLKHFHYGPLEWLWRSLIYGQRQRFRKDHNPPQTTGL